MGYKLKSSLLLELDKHIKISDCDAIINTINEIETAIKKNQINLSTSEKIRLYKTSIAVLTKIGVDFLYITKRTNKYKNEMVL